MQEKHKVLPNFINLLFLPFFSFIRGVLKRNNKKYIDMPKMAEEPGAPAPFIHDSQNGLFLKCVFVCRPARAPQQ